MSFMNPFCSSLPVNFSPGAGAEATYESCFPANVLLMEFLTLILALTAIFYTFFLLLQQQQQQTAATIAMMATRPMVPMATVSVVIV